MFLWDQKRTLMEVPRFILSTCQGRKDKGGNAHSGLS